MERAIAGYHLDDEGDWVAELSCGHNQHVRHRPPFQLRAWVLAGATRAERLGSPLDCPLGERAELPDGLRFVRSSPVWNEETVPTALLHAHRVARSTWGRIVVHDGNLRFRASTTPTLDVVLDADSLQAIPPDVDHAIELTGTVRFSIEFLSVDRRSPSDADHDVEVGSPRHERSSDGDTVC